MNIPKPGALCLSAVFAGAALLLSTGCVSTDTIKREILEYQPARSPVQFDACAVVVSRPSVSMARTSSFASRIFLSAMNGATITSVSAYAAAEVARASVYLPLSNMRFVRRSRSVAFRVSMLW